MNRVGMEQRNPLIRKALVAGFVAVLLVACGQAKPLVHDIPQPGEIPPGPGLLSGNDGKLILYGGSGGD